MIQQPGLVSSSPLSGNPESFGARSRLKYRLGGLMNIALTAVSITDPVFVPHRIMKKPLAA